MFRDGGQLMRLRAAPTMSRANFLESVKFSIRNDPSGQSLRPGQRVHCVTPITLLQGPKYELLLRNRPVRRLYILIPRGIMFPEF